MSRLDLSPLENARAAEVFAILPEFAKSAHLLLQALKEKEDQDA